MYVLHWFLTRKRCGGDDSEIGEYKFRGGNDRTSVRHRRIDQKGDDRNEKDRQSHWVNFILI